VMLRGVRYGEPPCRENRFRKPWHFRPRRVMRRIGKSRQELLETLDRPALDARRHRIVVAGDVDVIVGRHLALDPFRIAVRLVGQRLIREVVEARITDTTVEILHKGTRVASHARSPVRNRHTTITEHMPSAHRRYAEWTPARVMREAARIGPSTIALVEAIMKAKPHPEQGFRSCLGILRLARSYGAPRLEAAARRGNDIGARSYSSVASILKHGLDRAYAQDTAPEGEPIRHANIRGQGYYH
jgi:Mu transposase, C-terminal domain